MHLRRAASMLAFLSIAACGPESGEGVAAGDTSSLISSRKFIHARQAVPNEYIVVLNDSQGLSAASVSVAANDLAAAHGGRVQRTFSHALKGFSVRMTEAQARALAEDPQVKYVEQNG